jgi:hypothetical protein
MNSSRHDWLFAYGSNMNVEDFREWLTSNGHCADGILRVEPATLPGYRIVWNYYSVSRKGGAANVEPCAGRELPGLALSVNEATLKATDHKEGHPSSYNRGSSRLAVRLYNGETVDAWLYVAVRDRCSATPVLPRREYLQLLVDAARRYSLPPWHITELEATQPLD